MEGTYRHDFAGVGVLYVDDCDHPALRRDLIHSYNLDAACDSLSFGLLEIEDVIQGDPAFDIPSHLQIKEHSSPQRFGCRWAFDVIFGTTLCKGNGFGRP
jgi:hypothetical protein